LLIKINKLRLIEKLISRLKISSKINKFNKEQTFDKTIKSIKNLSKRSNYKRIINKSVVNFLKEKYLIQVLFN